MSDKNKPELLGSMTSYLNLMSNCVTKNKGVKRLWFKGLVYLKQAVLLQKDSQIDKLLNKEESIQLIPELHRHLEKKYHRSIQIELITHLCKDGHTKEEIENRIETAIDTFDGKISCLVPKYIDI